ncbi:MAG TPA: putative Ig domain-containing protein, partial [Streptosporangiaceae bacterium]|nr:putative Ig domain-containing protein [Streptosporangiaceae bacterium]
MPPTISGSPATSVVAGQNYSFMPTTTDPSGKTLTFSISNKPSWASFSTGTGQLSGTPAAANVGTYSNIVISVSDGTSSAALPAFAIAVTAPTPAPTPPTISGSPATSVVAGQNYSFVPTTTDPSGMALTFSISNKPSWASFSTGTGQLSGTPAAANVGSYSNIVISVSDGTLSASLAAFSIGVTAAPPVTGSGAPLVLYTDLISGPNSGGENNKGAYLSIFGKNFGSSGLGTTVKVSIGGVEVDNYRYLGPSKGRTDIQQITVQVGALGNPAPGTALPIQVTVNGVASNADQTFMVNPGRMLFVDNTTGNDSTAVIGDITHPFRHVQTSTLSQGAWGQVQPGDFIVLRGTGTAWTDVGYQSYFMRYRDKSGSAPTGASGTGAIVVMGYPTEDAYIRGTLAAGQKMGCISAINGQSYPGMGQWAVISNLRIDCEGYDGPISQEIYGNHWRVVNNDLAASTAPTSGPRVPRMAGITGNGTGSVWLGNHIHDIQGSPQECHGIYIDGDGSYEIAYNLIENIRSGNGFQIYVNGGNGSNVA